MVSSVKVNGVEYRLNDWELVKSDGIWETFRRVSDGKLADWIGIYESVDHRLCVMFGGCLGSLASIYCQMFGSSVIMGVNGFEVQKVFRTQEISQAQQFIDDFLRKANLAAFLLPGQESGQGPRAPIESPSRCIIRKECVMLDEFIKQALQGGRHVVIDYEHGARISATHCAQAYIRYNTGDQIWLAYQGGEYRIVRIEDSQHNIYDP